MLQRKAQQPRNILRLEKKLKKDLMMIVERLKLIHKLSRMACPLTCVHCRRWGIDVGQARNVKLHIDLMLKLHKMLNKAGHARTEDE